MKILANILRVYYSSTGSNSKFMYFNRLILKEISLPQHKFLFILAIDQLNAQILVL